MPSNLTLAMTLTLNFQGQKWNLLHLSQKWSDCHEKKSKHNVCTLGLKCDLEKWPWPWPSPSIFKVKYEICHISTKNGPIARKWKANILIEFWASNSIIRFDLGMTLTLDCQGQILKQPYLRNRRANWCPGDTWSQGISNHDIDLVKPS